ncbi:MAG: hypothetical protein HKN41_01540 [Ilumatobacter sp.]|nr:hypothetical protein [Ilumatobacter sp.]
MSVDPRTPVIVGVGQRTERELGVDPLDIMTGSTEDALADSGAGDQLRSRIDAVRVVWGVWPYRDPGRLVAERIGSPAARTTMTPVGGNQVYDLVNDTCARIARGELDVAVVTAAEALRTRRHDHRAGRRTDYHPEPEAASPDEMLGDDRPMSLPAEEEAGLGIAVNFYAMAETAIRHRNGESVDDHRMRVAELWASASRVAATNPDAWIRDEHTAQQIAQFSSTNRPVASPYPKLMTSNLNVDQGGAVILCSALAAEAAGVPRDRWIFPWSGSAAADHWYATNRWAFDESPAMRLVGARALSLAELTLDDVALLDLYSCFPAAVQVAQREMAIPVDRPFTITGGLTFAAGPLNCYCILPLTRAVRLLRDDPSEHAFLTGNGGWFTKHSALVLGGGPSPSGYVSDTVQAAVDALPHRPTPDRPANDGMLETYTVTFDREMQPERAILACLDAHGRRHWAASTDGEILAELLADDCCERPVKIDDGVARLV